MLGFFTSKKPKPAPKPADEPKAVREDAAWGMHYSREYAKWTKKDAANLGGDTKTLKEYAKLQARARGFSQGGWQNWPTALLILTMTIFDSLVDEDNKNPPHRRQILEQLQSSAYSSASLRLSPFFYSALQAAALVLPWGTCTFQRSLLGPCLLQRYLFSIQPRTPASVALLGRTT